VLKIIKNIVIQKIFNNITVWEQSVNKLFNLNKSLKFLFFLYQIKKLPLHPQKEKEKNK